MLERTRENHAGRAVLLTLWAEPELLAQERVRHSRLRQPVQFHACVQDRHLFGANATLQSAASSLPASGPKRDSRSSRYNTTAS